MNIEEIENQPQTDGPKKKDSLFDEGFLYQFCFNQEAYLLDWLRFFFPLSFG